MTRSTINNCDSTSSPAADAGFRPQADEISTRCRFYINEYIRERKQSHNREGHNARAFIDLPRVCMCQVERPPVVRRQERQACCHRVLGKLFSHSPNYLTALDECTNEYARLSACGNPPPRPKDRDTKHIDSDSSPRQRESARESRANCRIFSTE